MKTRLSIDVKGAIQGVGFRPFVHRLANELNLKGYVLNSPGGVQIEIEGEQSTLEIFLSRLHNDKPHLAIITSCEFSFLDPLGLLKFEIRESSQNGETQTLIMPDISICDDCLKELFDSSNRRYLYPFINCTNCGPRFSIIEKLPYDRPNTSMKIFEMCDDCRREYENISDRRYHAQPIACAKCGPHVELWNATGKVIASHNEAIVQVCERIRSGDIIAVKGLGGFQLIVNSNNDDAVKRLRKKKHRDEKPFAVMFPDINSIKCYCNISSHEEIILLSPESPIVLVAKKTTAVGQKISDFVAPANPYLGVMLPYTPLHHILMRNLQFPIVATSGNLSDEPMCIDEYEALQRLHNIADYFLVHNRPILRYVDDSIVRIVNNRPMVIRRARGYAPLPFTIKNLDSNKRNASILSLGGHLKNSIALKHGENIFVSQHIGDLSNKESLNSFKEVINDFQHFYKTKPDIILGDLHPDYLSTKHGKTLTEDLEQIQHHYAHVASCRIENEVQGDALGVAWDGTGLGYDSTIWGGEFFLSCDSSHTHIGQFKQFMLPGGESAVKDSRRSAVGVLYSLYGKVIPDYFLPALDKILKKNDTKIFFEMMEKKINSPKTSSVGRLFDAISSLLGICQRSNYEGQAAMILEFVAAKNIDETYSSEINEENIFVVNWHPTVHELLTDLINKMPVSIISAKFHNTLAEVILKFAERTNLEKVILSGGCFQNLYLIERTIQLLQKNKFKVYWHHRIPTNDGGISLGQIAAYLAEFTNHELAEQKGLIKENS
jgi:hydrogenase maturation protein HypF